MYSALGDELSCSIFEVRPGREGVDRLGRFGALGVTSFGNAVVLEENAMISSELSIIYSELSIMSLPLTRQYIYI